MADKVRRIDYFYFEVQDKPGEGARLLGKLADGGVLLLFFVAFPAAGGKAQFTVVPEKPDLTKRLHQVIDGVCERVH